MTPNLQIGNRIKQAREIKGLTQEQLGKELGLNKSTIQRYETGQVLKIKLPVLESIANALNVNPEWLALKSDVMEPVKLKSINFNTSGAKPREELTPEDIAEIYKTLPNSLKRCSKALENLKETLLEAHADNIEAVIYYYYKLNHEGRKEILKRIVELNQIDKYKEKPQENNEQLGFRIARSFNDESKPEVVEVDEPKYINAPDNDIDM